MGAKKSQTSTAVKRNYAPAPTIEGRENQLISLAVDLAEKQLKEGTASSQVITHYLKLGSTKERLEKEKLIEENKLLKARTEAIESSKDSALFYKEVIKAMQRYSGDFDGDDDSEDDELDDYQDL